MAADIPCYTLVSGNGDDENVPEADLRLAFEKGSVSDKVNALQQCVRGMLRGEKYPTLLMQLIRFILPMKEHAIKKMLLLYFEIVPKLGPEGKLLPQMILVCDAYRKDLQSPNEFVRGSTLRFLCKLKESELLEPLMPAIKACLEHRHYYVRRNAVLCIYTLYKQFDFLMPDAPEVIFNCLSTEPDMTVKRNAFMMLVYADKEKALEYLSTCIDQVPSFGDILQLVVIELVYKVCRSNPGERAKFIRCIYMLLNSGSASVRYEAAGVLLTLSTAPTAAKAAVSCFIDLVVKESDNNVRLIVLKKLSEMRHNPAIEKILQDLVMDLLRVLNAPDLEVRRQTLEIVMGLVTSRTVEEVLQLLRKEITKTFDESETSDAYRRQLIKALHQCAVKFPDKAVTIVPILMEFIGDSNSASAADVVASVREAIEFFPQLRENIIERLLGTFSHVKSAHIFRAAMWLLGEYCVTVQEMDDALATFQESLGALPMVESELKLAAAIEGEEGDGVIPEELPAARKKSMESARIPVTSRGGGSRVTADGTYVTQSAFSVMPSKSEQLMDTEITLRTLMLQGEFFLAATLAGSLTKLALRRPTVDKNVERNNKYSAQCMLIMASIMHLGKSGLPAQAIGFDTYERVSVCFRCLAEPTPSTSEIFTVECRRALKELLSKITSEQNAEAGEAEETKVVPVDQAIKFAQLGTKEDEVGDDLEKDMILAQGGTSVSTTSALQKVVQLTGFGDPVYAEAYVNVNQYDITLDVLMVNQTDDTLQGLSLELATIGDLKLMERPAVTTLGARDFVNLTSSIKVSSTDTGLIFGHIVYDISGTAEHGVIVLNDIYIDVMDYIVPSTCTETVFRQMWAEFEWENKVTVSTDISSLEDYSAHICKATNMKCLTIESGKGGDCGFYAANLYARSIFGEDALANLSIEKTKDDRIVGHIRIRAKAQGIALSLGDKITMKQKSDNTQA
eukprot:CFRG5786T1